MLKLNFFCVFAYNSRVVLHEKLGTKSLQKYAKKLTSVCKFGSRGTTFSDSAHP